MTLSNQQIQQLRNALEHLNAAKKQELMEKLESVITPPIVHPKNWKFWK
jgi:hypothetical protein